MQSLKREPDVLAALGIFADAIGAVHFLPNIGGNRGVERRFGRGKLVFGGICAPLREQEGAVESAEFFLGHAPHQIGNIDRLGAITRATLESVAVEQGHKKLEVLLFAVVRGGGHQQEMAASLAKEVAEPVALRDLDLIAKARG